MGTAASSRRPIETTGALCDRARRLLLAGDPTRALRTFQLASLKAPLEPAPWIGVGLCQEAMGQPGPAALAFSMARALGADDPALLVKEAQCRVRLGDTAGARAQLAEALEAATRLGDPTRTEAARAALAWLSQAPPPSRTTSK